LVTFLEPTAWQVAQHLLGVIVSKITKSHPISSSSYLILSFAVFRARLFKVLKKLFCAFHQQMRSIHEYNFDKK
jgi:hypothetical protein